MAQVLHVCWHIAGLMFLVSVARESVSSNSGHETWPPTWGSEEAPPLRDWSPSVHTALRTTHTRP